MPVRSRLIERHSHYAVWRCHTVGNHTSRLSKIEYSQQPSTVPFCANSVPAQSISSVPVTGAMAPATIRAPPLVGSRGCGQLLPCNRETLLRLDDQHIPEAGLATYGVNMSRRTPNGSLVSEQAGIDLGIVLLLLRHRFSVTSRKSSEIFGGSKVWASTRPHGYGLKAVPRPYHAIGGSRHILGAGTSAEGGGVLRSTRSNRTTWRPCIPRPIPVV